MEKQNAAIFILTQNTEVRRTYLKTCLYFLFKYFNEQFQYPVCILHEGDYDARSQREIIMSVRATCRHLVSFVSLDADDFVLPSHIDEDKMNACIDTKAVPYWRNAKYRMMCRWWLVHFPKYAKGYEYVMRLDDDAFIEEHIESDLFAWMKGGNYVYASNMVHVDCGICCYGMSTFFKQQYPDKHDTLGKLFLKQTVPSRSVQFHPFRLLLSITHAGSPPDVPEQMELEMPIMYYNNFFITKMEFWERPDVRRAIDEVDKTGNIFYYRWGDAPLQSIIAMLHAEPNQITRAVFRYSKRLQREAFVDDKNESHSFMPMTYKQTSCTVRDKAESS